MSRKTTTRAAPDIAARRLPGEAYLANFEADAKEPLDLQARRGRGEPLLFLLRRALHRGLPDRHRHPELHPQDRDRQRQGRGDHDPRGEHHGRHLRARLPDRGPVRAGLRAQQRSEDKPVDDRRAAALRHRLAVRARRSSPSAARRAPASASPWSAAGRRASPAPIGWRMLGPRRDGVRGAGQARRAQRVRHRRLQGAARLRASARSTFILSLGGIEPQHGKALGRDMHAGAAARATTTRCSSASAWPASTRCRLEGEEPAGRRRRGRLHRASCARRRTSRGCRSAGASS